MKINSKILFLFFILTVPNFFVAGEELLSFLNGGVSFQRPENITRWEERPRFNSVIEQANYWLGKIRLMTNIYDVETLSNEPPTVMARAVYDLVYKKGYLSRNDLLDLFTVTPEFVLHKYNQDVDIRNSYKLIRSNGVIIGETFFHANSIKLQAPTVYGYTICLIINDTIFNIYLSFAVNKDFYTTNNMSIYFDIHDQNYYWKDEDAILVFYECLTSEEYKNLPKQLQLLRESRDVILDTLRINDMEIEF